jgi:hypothetical protein
MKVALEGARLPVRAMAAQRAPQSRAFLASPSLAALSPVSLAPVVITGVGIIVVVAVIVYVSTESSTGTCSCQHRDIFQSGGQSCQTLREQGICTGPYVGEGTNQADCQRNARENTSAQCRGCLGHCIFRRGR